MLNDRDRERLPELLQQALALSEPQRGDFLARNCDGHAALRAELESLIAHAADDDTFLNEPALTPRSTWRAPTSGFDPAPEWIGAVRVSRRLGMGGMGSVYLGTRADGTRVAAKVIHVEMATPALRKRFALERDVLEQLAHPNIARILSTGSTELGLPYFTMEFVDGPSLLQYCRDRRLPLGARLDLFAQACAGVQHAHDLGVLHRDLHPSNLLVETTANPPLVKVIDFGLARCHRLLPVDADRRVQRLTPTGAVLGTRGYMSPEQEQGRTHAIDQRTDVYGLACTLHQVVTGELSDRSSWHRTRPAAISASYRAAMARIRLGWAQQRQVKHMAEAMRRHLDAVLDRALAVDPEQRYRTVGEFAQRLEAFRSALRALPPGPALPPRAP